MIAKFIVEIEVDEPEDQSEIAMANEEMNRILLELEDVVAKRGYYLHDSEWETI